MIKKILLILLFTIHNLHSQCEFQFNNDYIPFDPYFYQPSFEVDIPENVTIKSIKLQIKDYIGRSQICDKDDYHTMINFRLDNNFGVPFLYNNTYDVDISGIENGTKKLTLGMDFFNYIQNKISYDQVSFDWSIIIKAEGVDGNLLDYNSGILENFKIEQVGSIHNGINVINGFVDFTIMMVSSGAGLYSDRDGDGYGDSNEKEPIPFCGRGSFFLTDCNFVDNNDDCNDNDFLINPREGNCTLSSIKIDTDKDQVAFPTLVDDFLYIKTNSQIRNLTLINSEGKIIYKENTIDNKIDLSHLRSGVYFLKIEIEKGNIILQKIIKL